MTLIEEVRGFSSFLGLEKEWNSVLQKSENDSIFLRHEWFRSWWEAYGAEKELLILLIKENGELLGICPFMISKGHFRGFPIKKISFIENDETPRLNMIYIKGRNEIVGTIIGYLLQKVKEWNILILNKIPVDSESYAMIQKVCRENKLFFFNKTSWQSPFLKIETDWNTFYKNTSQRLKKRLRYNNNQLKKLGDIEISQIDGREKDLEDVFSIGRSSWKNKIDKSISSTEENKKFFSSLTATADTKGWLYVWMMKANGKPVAFEYDLQYKGKVHALRSEFDEEYASYSPGAVLENFIIKSIFENGFKEYDMGGSADEYKKHWTTSIREHVNILVFNKGLYSKLMVFVEGTVIPYIKRKQLFQRLKKVQKPNNMR